MNVNDNAITLNKRIALKTIAGTPPGASLLLYVDPCIRGEERPGNGAFVADQDEQVQGQVIQVLHQVHPSSRSVARTSRCSSPSISLRLSHRLWMCAMAALRACSGMRPVTAL